MKRKQVKGLLDYWQKRLRLADWRVTLVYKNCGKEANFMGRCRMNAKLKCAVMFINRLSEAEQRKQDPIEVTVIHELVHLHMVTWEPRNMRKRRYVNYEAAIDSLAWGLFMTRYPGYVDPSTK